jgi:hypothetical protein
MFRVYLTSNDKEKYTWALILLFWALFPEMVRMSLSASNQVKNIPCSTERVTHRSGSVCCSQICIPYQISLTTVPLTALIYGFVRLLLHTTQVVRALFDQKIHRPGLVLLWAMFTKRGGNRRVFFYFSSCQACLFPRYFLSCACSHTLSGQLMYT